MTYGIDHQITKMQNGSRKTTMPISFDPKPDAEGHGFGKHVNAHMPLAYRGERQGQA